MQIYVEDEGKKVVNIRIPTRLLVNNLTASVVPKVIEKHVKLDVDFKLTTKQGRILARTIHACKRQFPDLYLVEVESDESVVKIKL